MKASIFDVLTGTFANGRPVTSVSEDQRLLLSVVSNLNRLFNTRRGTVGHLPDYGLPDMLTVYRDSPQSADELRRAVKESIETYEPRLNRVRVRRRETDEHSMRLVFIVKAELENGDRVRFETMFESQKTAKVKPVGSYV
ncbi:MAG: type VI secretion system baseplate subunit TssE [Salinibacter sp.]|uniref:type VI secretion system baseplate subunit TssE n=1 Tax=Salinibacter sp. TaxID=2065818 RepID=UPI0035D450C7